MKSQKNALIVEDDIKTSTVIQKYLEKQGVGVSLARNGIEALELLDKNQFSVILSDYNMPLMNGKELFDNLLKRGSKIPFYMMSGEPNIPQFDQMKENGLIDYLKKPFHLSDLDKML